MESAAVLRPFNYAISTNSHLKTVNEKPGMLTMNNASFVNHCKLPFCGGNLISVKNRRESLFVSCVKTSDTTLTDKSNGDPNGAVLSGSQPGILEKKTSTNATFPNGFEALLTEVCDETKIAELKLKVGAFELHMRRNIDGPAIPSPVVYEAAASFEQTPLTPPPPPPKSSTEKVSPFSNASAEKTAKLAALEASGPRGYVVVSSPTVGSFRRARTLKGKKQPPACKEGDVIKEGQVIGFLDQFGTELPIRSDVAGEVLKLLYSDGEAAGYGDPLIAILPSFHGTVPPPLELASPVTVLYSFRSGKSSDAGTECLGLESSKPEAATETFSAGGGSSFRRAKTTHSTANKTNTMLRESQLLLTELGRRI